MDTALPALDVHTRAFLEHPNRSLVRDGQRLAIAQGTSGPEFFTCDAVAELFREPRLRPKTAQVYLDMGITRDSPIYAFLTNGNFNMMSAEERVAAVAESRAAPYLRAALGSKAGDPPTEKGADRESRLR